MKANQNRPTQGPFKASTSKMTLACRCLSKVGAMQCTLEPFSSVRRRVNLPGSFSTQVRSTSQLRALSATTARPATTSSRSTTPQTTTLSRKMSQTGALPSRTTCTSRTRAKSCRGARQNSHTDPPTYRASFGKIKLASSNSAVTPLVSK